MWKNGACTKPTNRPAVLRIAPGALTSVHPIYQILGPTAHRRRFGPLGTVSIDLAIHYWLVPSGRSRPGEPDRSLGKRVLPAILQAVTPVKREQHVDGSREGRSCKTDDSVSIQTGLRSSATRKWELRGGRVPGYITQSFASRAEIVPTSTSRT